MRKSFALVTAGLAVFVLFFWIYFPALSKYRDLKIQEEDMSDELKDVNQKIATLSEEKKLLENDPAYVEKVIRDELGLVKPGEVVYKFVQEQPPAVNAGPTAAVAPPSLPDLPEHKVQIPDLDAPKMVSPLENAEAPGSSAVNAPQPAPATLPAVIPPPKKKKPAVVNGEPVYPRQETR